MYDEKMFKETFSVLKASEETLTEVMKMTAKRKRIPAKTLLIAAALAAALIPAAFAFSGPLIQFMFGNSSAAQVDEISDGYGGNDVMYCMEIVNRSEAVDETQHDGYNQFDTIEEAQRFSRFTVNAPGYLPKNVTGMDWVAVQRYKDGNAGYEIHIQYTVKMSENNFSHFHLVQYYAGLDAYLNFSTIYPIQKVMIGDIEASAVFGDGHIWLYWIKDEMAYNLSDYTAVTGYDLETLIAIAESV